MANANLYAAFSASFARHRNQHAFIEANGRSVTYAQLSESIDRYAAVLLALGVSAGDRITVQVEKSLASVYLYLATLKVGAVYNPLNTAYTATELDYFVTDAEPSLIVVPDLVRSVLAGPASKSASIRIETLEADGSGTIAELAKGAAGTVGIAERAGDDLAALLYTSGTTGRSKGAMITHDNLSSNAATLSSYWGFSQNDVLLHALPIFHVHGLFVALHTALLNGVTILWHPKFDLESVLKELPRATVMMGVPTFYTRLLSSPHLTRATVGKMRLVISGSAPLLAETHIEFEARTGHKILERYGMTEAGMITSNPYHGGERVAGTVGYALPGIDLRLRDPEGRPVPQGEPGVLEVKGPNVFSGYWRNPEKTREDFRPDGYFITGDIATIAPDGRVAIVGRAKDLIISGGFNVYPKEIETEINALDGIEESAVIGCPHPDFGEGVVAVVTRTPGTGDLNEQQILAQLTGRLARFKLPKKVYVVEALPRNAMGKVQKAELRKQYETTFKS